MNLPMEEWNGAYATKELHATLLRLVDESNAQARQMLSLTRAITWLTVVMLVAVCVQIVVAIIR